MSQALSALVANLKTRVEALTDTDTKVEALWALETFQGAAGAYEAGAARGPVSYSTPAGTSYNFPSKAEAREAMNAARAEVMGLLSYSGGTGYVDMGGSQW